jgi:DNA-binding NarL/FixJ family response regulator
MSTSILLVDDHKIFLAGLAEIIDRTAGMHVVATAADAGQAMLLIRQHRPDIVVTDIAMPGIDGFALSIQIVAEFSDTKIICMTMHADAQMIQAMFKAGAVGYVLTDCELSELIEAIRTVTAGETYMSGSVVKVLAESFRQQRRKTCKVSDVELTEREHQVLVMMADGLTTKQIAGKLRRSTKTVGTYREHLMQKLGVHSVAELTKYAIRRGLASAD